MSLQARQSEWDTRLYNVGRDVAHNMADVMRVVSDRLEKGTWPALTEVCKKFNVTEEELGKACQAFCLFVCSSADDKNEDMNANLIRSGWFTTPEVAQIAVQAIIGTVISGYYWAGAREATLGGVGPCLSSQDLRERGERCSKLMMLPRWRRKWNKVVGIYLRIKDALLSRESPGFRYREDALRRGHPQK